MPTRQPSQLVEVLPLNRQRFSGALLHDVPFLCDDDTVANTTVDTFSLSLLRLINELLRVVVQVELRVWCQTHSFQEDE